MNDYCKMISFSGGRSSAYMLFRMLPLQDDTIVCFANTGAEEPETLQFVKDCQDYWQIPIVWLEYCPVNKFKVVNFETASRENQPYEALIRKQGFLPNVAKRFCTSELKVNAIDAYLKSLGIKHYDSFVGMRYDEPARYHKLITQNDGGRNVWTYFAPLYKDRITKLDVLNFWQQQPFDLQVDKGKGNCSLCFLKGKSKLKNLIADEPQKADWYIRMEKLIGGTFIKGVSYEKLKYVAENQLDIFKDEPEIECICNVD